MPVPTLVTDLSTTLASNSPAGSDNVFPSLDEYLRAMSGFIASIRDNSGNGWVSPYATAFNPNYTGTLTGGTGVVNLGSGQFYKDASGNVGIGTATPGVRLVIADTNPTMQVNAASTGYTWTRYTNDSGNLYVGIENSTNTQFGAGAYSRVVWSQGAYPLVFGTNGAERARITSVGDLLVGTTTAAGDGISIRPRVSGGGPTSQISFNRASSASSGDALLFQNGGTTVGVVSYTNAATSYVTSSDRRLKENIAPAADAGAVIDAIEVVEHDWKVGGHTRFGVIAQDLQAVAPEAVSAGDDSDEIEKTWGVDYSKLVPMLIKEIQSLRARVAALEA